MKILIVTHYLDNYAGSELFTRDIALELKKNGHSICVYSPVLGLVSNEMMEKGLRVTDNLLEYKNINFDIIHAQHNVTAVMARSIFPKVPMVFMAHGVEPKLEQPPSIDLGIGGYIAVSDELKEHLIKLYSIPTENIVVVRNGVTKIETRNKINQDLKKALVISSHYFGKVREVVEGSCKELGIEVEYIGRPNNPVNDVYPYILKNDLVITIGRGVLEAIAMGRNVIAYDIHGGDGLITEKNFFEARKHNFSGRRFHIDYDKESFKKELQKYDPSIPVKLQEIIKKEHTVGYIANKLVDVYSEVKDRKFSSKLKPNEMLLELDTLEEILKAERNTKTGQKNLESQTLVLKEAEKTLKAIQGSRLWKLRNKLAPFIGKTKV